MNEDFTQSNDLAQQYPEKLRQMQDLWWVEATRYNVLPLDRPAFVYNYLSLSRITFEATQPLPAGKHTLVADFIYDGGGMGKGGKLVLKADGGVIAEGRLEKTVPVQFSIVEGLDIGQDGGSPVDWTYKMPFRFTGRIAKVKIDLK